MTTTGTRTGLLAGGIVVLIVGLLAGVALWVLSSERESDAVRNLARAPIGCDTTLSFDAGGEFLVFIETAGEFDANVSGDCGAEGGYELTGDELPAVSLVLTAPNGDDVTLDSRSGISYDTAGYVGESVRTLTVEEPGDYQLRVEAPGSADASFAATVGRDPGDGVAAMRLGAGGVALAGLLIGGLMMLLSRRSTEAAASPTDAPWPVQTSCWPTAPPTMPVTLPSGEPPPLGPPTQYPIGVPGGPPSGNRPGDGQRSPWAPPSDAAQ